MSTGASCTIGGVSFGQLAGATNGRYCLECYAHSLEYSLRRFHPPAVAGNFIVRGNRNGGTITANLRYINTYSSILSNYNSDRAAWENTAVTIVDEAGATYLNCNLIPGSMHRVHRPRAIGRTVGQCVMDIEAQWHYDG